MDVGIVDALCDFSRPVFLFGLTPPLEGTDPEATREVAQKFVDRSRNLATDGFIVYDIQEEKGRTPEPRPFPFRKLDDPSHFANILADVSGKESVVYKCVVESNKQGFENWLNKAVDTYGVKAYNLVGGASSAQQYAGPTIPDVANMLKQKRGTAYGGVTIAERHIKKGNEHETLMKKADLGMEWFISQAIYDPEPMIQLLKDYGALCKSKGVTPKRIILTFAPCGREKTMRFIKWLGVTVPEQVEKDILEAENKVGKSVDLLCEMCTKILQETKGCGVPLGVSVESVSIFKNEIDAAHDLFRRTQAILLDFLEEPWLVRYSIVPKGAKRTSFDYDASGKRPVKVAKKPLSSIPSGKDLAGSAAAAAAAAPKETGAWIQAVGILVLGVILGKLIK